MLFSMFFEMFMGVGVGVMIILAIIAIVGILTVLFTCCSILYSRIALSLLVGLVAGNANEIVASGFPDLGGHRRSHCVQLIRDAP